MYRIGDASVWWALVLAGAAMNRRWRQQPAVWFGALYAAAYVVLGVASYPWYYAIPMYGLVVAAGAGLSRMLPSPWIQGVAVLMAFVTAVPWGLPPGRAEAVVASQWIADRAREGEMVGAAEIGIVAVHSGLQVRSYLGLLNPERGERLGTLEMADWVEEDRPDWLILTDWGADVVVSAMVEGRYMPVWEGDHLTVFKRRRGGRS